MTATPADAHGGDVPSDGATTTAIRLAISPPTATGAARDYRDLCIEDLALEIAAVDEKCAAYRFCFQMSLGALATVTKERDRFRTRYFSLIDQHRRTATASCPRPNAAATARGRV
jgi:hypothetical protein